MLNDIEEKEIQLTPEQEEAAAALNTRQLRFANLLLTQDMHGLNDSECYKSSGFKGKDFSSCATRLKKNKKVSLYLSLMRRESVQSVGLELKELDTILVEMLHVSMQDIVATEAVKDDEGEETLIKIPYLKEHLQDMSRGASNRLTKVKSGRYGLEVEVTETKALLELGYRRLGAFIDKFEDVTNEKGKKDITDDMTPDEAAQLYQDAILNDKTS